MDNTIYYQIPKENYLKDLAKKIATYELNNETDKIDEEELMRLSFAELCELDEYVLDFLDNLKNI